MFKEKFENKETDKEKTQNSDKSIESKDISKSHVKISENGIETKKSSKNTGLFGTEKSKVKISEKGIEIKESSKSDTFGNEKTKVKISENGIERKSSSEKNGVFGKEKSKVKISDGGIEVNDSSKSDVPGKSKTDMKVSIANKAADVIAPKTPTEIPGFPLTDNNEKETVTLNVGKVTEMTGKALKTGGTVVEKVGEKVVTKKPDVGAVIIAGGEAAKKVGSKIEDFGIRHPDKEIKINVPIKYSRAVDFAERLKIAERKEKDAKAETIRQNKLDGCSREETVGKELTEAYPESKGYSTIREAYLRDNKGNIVKDSQTGQARRIDFVVVKDGQVVKSVEVTSDTADKRNQTAKELRIKENGGTFIRDKEGNLVKHNVNTEIERRA